MSIDSSRRKRWKEWNEKFESVVRGILWLIFAAWMVAVFLLPFFEVADESRINTSAINSNFRAVIMAGDNLRYYITRSEFEDVPYPDRPAVVKEIATSWCEQASLAFLPSVYLYDIKTGERLDRYNCFWSWVESGSPRSFKNRNPK